MDRKPAARRSSTSTDEEFEFPEGVERHGRRIRITFRFQGSRRREPLTIPITKKNIAYAANRRGEILNAIERGTFNYSAEFPDSKYARELAKKDPKSPGNRKDYLLMRFVDMHIDRGRDNQSMSPSTIETYKKWKRSQIEPEFAGKHVDEITTLDMMNWATKMSKNLANKSVKTVVGVVHSAFQLAIAGKYLKEDPLGDLKLKTILPPESKRMDGDEDEDVNPFNQKEIGAILAACDRIHEKALFQFAFASGLRTGELIALKWRHINWLSGTVRVVDNIVSGENRQTVEKGVKKDGKRIIPLLPTARQALEMMRPITQMLNNGDYVFTPDGKNRWRNDQQIRRRWEIILRDAKVDYRKPYQTRHTFASTLLMNGEPEKVVATLLGHTTVAMVRQHYGRFIPDEDGAVTLKSTYDQLSGDKSVGKNGADSGARLGQKIAAGAQLGRRGARKSS